MTDITHFLNNKEVKPPKNWQEMTIDINHDKDNPNSTVKITDWDFWNDNAHLINEWIAKGRIFEGLPYRIEVEKSVVFNGYIDLTDGSKFSCYNAHVTSKERLSIDWLNDVADGFTFEYLFKEVGSITKNDFVRMPYVISSIPDYTSVVLSLLSAYVITRELTDAIEKLAELAVSAANPLELTSLVRAAMSIIYIIATLTTLIILISQIINYLIQPVKYHSGMKVRTLFEKGCQYLGLTFDTSVDMDDLVIIPEKNQIPTFLGQLFTFGIIDPNESLSGFYKGTFGDFIRNMKVYFNAKIYISDGVLSFVRRDYKAAGTKLVIPNIVNDYYEYNTADFRANYYLKFQTDVSDRNTIQEYNGTAYQVTIRPIVFDNADLILTKNAETISIPFALAKVKTELTFVEQIISGFLDVIGALMNGLISAANALIQLYNYVAGGVNDMLDALDFFIGIDISFRLDPIPPIKYVNFGSVINNRIGMMKLSNDSFSTPKIFKIKEGNSPSKNKIHPNNGTVVSAKNLWESYHNIDSFVPTPTNEFGNQKIYRDLDKIPFCHKDYLTVKNSNAIEKDGKTGSFTALSWNPFQGTAKIRYYVDEVYTDNLKEIKYEPTGS